MEDAMFYVAGVGVSLAAGASRATSRARLPMLGLLGVSLLGERVLLDRLHSLLGVNERGEVSLM